MNEPAMAAPDQIGLAAATEDFLGSGKLEDGIGPCLSGGGFRAMLFHLGSLIRLNEVGLLNRLDRVASVSGGSLTAGILAAAWSELKFDENGVATNLYETVSVPLLRLARWRIDVPAVLLGLLPFLHAANIAARAYEWAVFGKKTLRNLPERPRFVFTSTSLQTGVLWRFARDYAAEWRVGEWPNPDLRLSLAVAASASFPPFMSPTRIKPPNDVFRQSEGNDLFNRDYTSTLILTDGGVYDNLGLEPVWKRYRTILVSDGGLVTAAAPKPATNWYSQFRRVLDISLQQGINTRVRILRGLDATGQRKVVHWGIGIPVAYYGVGNPLSFESQSTQHAAHVATRLTRFPAGVQNLVIKADYAHTDAALRASGLPTLVASTADFAVLPKVA
jgi:NTE family protein